MLSFNNNGSGVSHVCHYILQAKEVPIYSRFIRPTPELAIFLSFYYNSSGISQMCRSIPPSLAIPTIAVLHKFRSYFFPFYYKDVWLLICFCSFSTPAPQLVFFLFFFFFFSNTAPVTIFFYFLH